MSVTPVCGGLRPLIRVLIFTDGAGYGSSRQFISKLYAKGGRVADGMVTAADVGLRIMEVTAILLPLMGIFTQVFIRHVVLSDSGWSDRKIRLGYLIISGTTLAIVVAGAGAIVPFISADTPLSILLPLFALYIGYFGIGITIVSLAGVGLYSEEPIQQILLSAWGDRDE